MHLENLCGLVFWHPKWLQRFATTKMFMAVYGLLGTIQAMSHMYIIVTLTTMEKRFKMPSETTGIILSGNEISQILLSVILSYIGGQRNRPRWIAWGISFCAMSCFIIALPHFIYGAGDDALHLTKEYFQNTNNNNHLGNRNNISLMNNNNNTNSQKSADQSLCYHSTRLHPVTTKQDCNDDEIVNYFLPLILVFLSQFVLGIGNSLYYSLGQTYLDDNMKKTKTPLMLAFAMTLRMIGPIIGFFLGYGSLSLFIDISKTPIIDKRDPRWLGAWWFGWIVLGFGMLVFALLMGLFPKKMPKFNKLIIEEHKSDCLAECEQENHGSENNKLQEEKIKLKDFPKTLLRLVRNKLLICNIFSGIFYLLGALGYMTFLAKIMEVQFHKSRRNATIVVGPMTITGMVIGFIASGIVITKKRPNAKKLLFWNLIVGALHLCGQITHLFIYCDNTEALIQSGGASLNWTTQCNAVCSCDAIPYGPVCDKSTDTTYFSACHAGCTNWDTKKKVYSNCLCTKPSNLTLKIERLTDEIQNINSRQNSFLNPGPCLTGCTMAFITFSILSMISNCLVSSGKIGNILVSYRAVAPEDKSCAQGLTLMLVSLFASIPGPIIYGKIIDMTCLKWTVECGKSGNCLFYDQTKFRYYVNLTSFGLTFIGVLFDILVWHYGKNLDLYVEKKTVSQNKEKSENVNVR